jgi:hypothetical protein
MSPNSSSIERLEPTQDQCIKNGLRIGMKHYQTACGSKEGCNGKLDLCNDHKTCVNLPINETVETLATSSFLSVDYLELKTDRISNKLLQKMEI